MIFLLFSIVAHAENLIPAGPLKHHYFLMRHAESIPNVEQRLCSSMKAGTAPENGLTEKGKKQALEAAQEWLKNNHGRSIVIVTSPFSRTLETVEIMKKEFEKLRSVRVVKDNQLIERFFGKLEGSPYSEAMWKKVSAQDSLDPKHAKSGIEPLDKLESRMTKVIEKLEKEKDRGQVYIIVSHGDPLAVLESSAQGKALTQYHLIPRFKNAEIRELTH